MDIIKNETRIEGTTVHAIRGIRHAEKQEQVRVNLSVDYGKETVESLIPRAFSSDLINWQSKLRTRHDSPRAMKERIQSLQGLDKRIVLPSEEFLSPSWASTGKVVTRIADPSTLDTATLLAALRKKADNGDAAAILALQALEG